MVDRRASSRPGDRYDDDGYYRPIEAPLERKYGLPEGLLSRIRKDGERTDKGRVSSAGAKSVYQIIPPTRNLFMNKYGVNAFAGDREAATVAALHLKESWDRSDGNLERTVREYHGGPNPKNWGPVNDAYARRVTGQATARSLTVPVRGTTVLAPQVDLSTVDVSALRDVRPSEIGSRRPLDPKPITDKEVAPKPTAAGLILGDVSNTDVTPGNEEATSNPSRVAEVQARQVETDRAAVTVGDRLEASWDRNWVTSMIGRAMDNNLSEGDPAWHKEYLSKIDDYEALAKDQDELDELRGSRAQNSREDFYAVLSNIEGRRKLAETVNSNGTGWAYDLGASLTDPTAWAVTAGVSKLASVTKAAATGAKAAMSARPSLTAMAVEGAGYNMAFTGLAEASGEQKTVGDYITAGAAGVAIGSALHGLTSRLGKADTSDKAIMDALAGRTQAIRQEVDDAALARVGADADEGTLERARQEVYKDRAEQAMAMAIAQRPDNDRFLPIDPELYRTADQKASKQVITANNLDSISDPATQRLAGEIHTRSEEIVAAAKSAGDLDKGLEGRFLQAFGQESDALTLLRSKNPVLMATAIQLLESTTGAGGRKASAALSLVMRERSYMGHMVNFDQAYDLWRRAEGKGKFQAALSADARNEFDRLVFREVEARGTDGARLTSNNAVKRAADSWERGMDQMRREMQEIGTLGNERLGNSSVGYMRHQMDPRKLMALNPQQRRQVESIMARQFQKLNEYSYVNKEGEKITKTFDAAFSRSLAKRYLDEAQGRAMGSTYIPANLHTSDGASIVGDAVKAMQGLAPEEAEAILGRFSRGGPSFTKGRLNFDLSEDIGNGVQLGDLFQQDLLSMYRSYARRTAGEVSLAQYGILGKQTLQIMRQTAQATGADVNQLKAFERISSEFLNEPWGKYDNITAFKNARALTSAATLGGMGFTQLAELGNAIPAVGVKAVLANIGSARRLVKEVGMFRKGDAAKNPILDDFDSIYGFVGGEDYAMTRLFDAPDSNVELYDQESIGLLSKTVRAGSHFTAVASGFRIIHAVQARGMAEQIVKKAIRYIHLDKESTALADMGISDEIRTALKANMDKIAKFDSKGNLKSLELFGDHGIPPRIIQDFAQTVERGAGQIIQKTFIGETGPWAHNEFLKFLLQFRTFGITSVEKQYGRNRANYGAIKSFGILIGAMGFALPIHLARLQAQSAGMSRSEREDFMDKRTNAFALSKALMQYTSVTGLAPDVLDITSQFGAKVGIMPDTWADAVDVRGRQGGITGVVPGLGYADKAYKGIVQGDFKQLPKLLPGANLPQVTPIINGLTPEDE